MTTRVPLLALLVLACASGPSVRPRERESVNKQQDSSTNQSGMQKTPIVIALDSEQQKSDAYQRQQDRLERAQSDTAINDYTLALVIVGVFQLAVFGYQALKLRQTVQAAAEQSTDMKSSIGQATRAATAIEDVAKAMEIQRKTTSNATDITRTQQREAVEIELRAYLEVDFPEYPNTAEGPNWYDVVIDVYNHGQTPARKAQLSAWYEISRSVTQHDYIRNPDLRAEMHDGPQTVAPGIGVASRLRLGIRPREADYDKIGAAVRDAKADTFLYVYGTLDYTDIFGWTHQTHFCGRFVANPLDRVDKYGWVACDIAAHNATTSAPDHQRPGCHPSSTV